MTPVYVTLCMFFPSVTVVVPAYVPAWQLALDAIS